MKIVTRDFGEVEIHEDDIVTFCQPVYGFDELRKYVFLHDDELGEQFVWLQSVEEPDICFILVDPRTVSDHYHPRLSPETTKQLGPEEYSCWLVTVIPEDYRASTVNLRSPIVVNPARRLAAQVILEEELPIRFPLFRSGKENEAC